MEKSWNSEALVYLRDLRKSELTVYEEVRGDILNYKKHINNKVDIYVELLIQQLTTSWMTLNENFTKQEKLLLKEKDTSSKEPFEDIAILPKEKLPKFIAGRLSECTLLEIFGKLDVQSPIDIEIKILESFETDLSYINPLCPINDRISFMGCAVDKTIRKTSVYPKLKEIKNNKQVEICSIVAFSSGELLMSCSNDSRLKLIELDGSIQLLYDFEPLIPKGVCIKDDKEILVGLREITDRPFMINHNSERQVRWLDSHGRTRSIYEFDNKHSRLFTVPTRIAASTSDTFVLDMKNEDNGRIVALNSKGNLKWIYNGCTFSQHKFCPNDLTLSLLSGLLIMPDTYNNALHFVNGKGELILYQRLNTFGINLPCSVATDYKGHLWVGTGKNKNKNAMIHLLSISK